MHSRLNIESAWNNWNRWQRNEGPVDSYPIVTRAFLYHLRYPIEWPILDGLVFRAMKELQLGRKYKTNKNISNWKTDYKNGYKEFFNELFIKNERRINSMDFPNIDGVDREIIKRRVLDRALWEFGRCIKMQKNILT